MRAHPHYAAADALLQHLSALPVQQWTPEIQSRYVGFLAISCAAVLELTLKDTLDDFASTHGPVFRSYLQKDLRSINARIRICHIRDEHLSRFGSNYLLRFDRGLDRIEQNSLRSSGKSIKAAYGNLIVWRHSFAHEGVVPSNASFNEVRDAYAAGKLIMDWTRRCLRI